MGLPLVLRRVAVEVGNGPRTSESGSTITSVQRWPDRATGSCLRGWLIGAGPQSRRLRPPLDVAHPSVTQAYECSDGRCRCSGESPRLSAAASCAVNLWLYPRR